MDALSQSGRRHYCCVLLLRTSSRDAPPCVTSADGPSSVSLTALACARENKSHA